MVINIRFSVEPVKLLILRGETLLYAFQIKFTNLKTKHLIHEPHIKSNAKTLMHHGPTTRLGRMSWKGDHHGIRSAVTQDYSVTFVTESQCYSCPSVLVSRCHTVSVP